MKSSLRIFKDVAATQFVEDVTELGWETYQRTAKGIMGDDTATFTVTGPETTLRVWFDTWLGYWFREYAGGLPELSAFTGQIYTMRLFLGKIIYRVSLDSVFNGIVVQYTDSSTGNKMENISVDNDKSLARYGRKGKIITYDIPTDSTSAANIGDELLNTMMWPIASIVGFGTGVVAPRLEITVKGSFVLLDGYFFYLASAGPLHNVSDDIAAVVAGLDGDSIIEENTNQMLEKLSNDPYKYQMRSERFKEAMEFSGGEWRAGYYGTPDFEYYKLNRTDPKYRIEFDGGRKIFYDNRTGVHVPDSLVRPGQYAKVPDTAMNLPTTLLIDGLTYSKDGLQFAPALEDRLAVLIEDIRGN